MLNELSLSGFTNPWYFLGLLVVAAVAVMYLWIQRAKRKRVLRFANMAVLDQVAPADKPSRWRHLPAALLVAALALLTTAMAGPTDNIRVPRNRAVVMLVIDVSESMAATDVAPSRIEAARAAAASFAEKLTPGINLGLVKFSSSAVMMVAPTADHEAVKRAINTLKPEPRTATGEGIFTALQAIATAGAVMAGAEGPPPARIVLESDGKETVPTDPDQPRGAFTAARAARDQHVPISTISFGTPYGTVNLDGQDIPVPVDDVTLKKIVEITNGQAFHAGSLNELQSVYSTLEQQVGYQTVRGDASASWIGMALLALTAAMAVGILVNRRLPL
ncbi:Ca-activated chloride channel family protein [Mycobacterium frederiksbergense]|uniref:Ca-activated chloride channel family protein n=1 Tax=Mycolicibacterium frederiksbergense TaxID=117567 RepID=A0ABT6L2N5_9MYCO|nr:VWA domain-containing protein [Mycolicibacterium frederiksbergense]MDH6197217.1 Ca-activated chloride channel family protein [Mycolicibacterium frederiksbergense]